MTQKNLDIQVGGVSFKVDPSNDQYGSEFWIKLNSNLYEPDTIKFLETQVGPNCIFMDIGAANGAMTLYAAARGANVISYEPENMVFQVLDSNLKLNPDLTNKVVIKQAGISTDKEFVRFGKGENRRILSDIVIDELKERADQVIEILSLSDELLTYAINGTKVVIKMDIEGAEWKILNDVNTLRSLKNSRATMLVAMHPGFYRKDLPGLIANKSLGRNIRRLQNFIDSIRVYEKITQFALVKRTNLDAVPNRFRFAFLITAGYFEFILDFS